MEVKYGKGKTEFGPGVSIEMSGDEVARAIHTYLVAHGVVIRGARSITVNDELCNTGHVYVDPSGFVIYEDVKFKGDGKEEPEDER